MPADQYLGQIMPFAGNFAPYQWALCQGQTLPISQYAALFSILGTYYGGNGTSTFALPNLQDTVALSMGQGPGLSNYTLGEQGGSTNVTLLQNQMPLHIHAINAYSLGSDSHTPQGNVFSRTLANGTAPYSDQTPDTTLNALAVLPTGGSQPHANQMPTLTVCYCIALTGIFPARN